MIIESAIIRDFMTLKEAEVAFDGVGLVLVQGANQHDTAANSNGAGKSSLMDAVSWALWDQTARGETGDGLIRNGAKKAEVLVTLRDEDSGMRWKIQRARTKGKGALTLSEIDLAGNVKEITKGTSKLTQAEIEKIMGSSYEVFKAAVYLGQDDLPNLPTMTDKKLKEIVEEAAGVQQLNAAYDLARARLTETKADLGKVTTERQFHADQSFRTRTRRDEEAQAGTEWAATVAEKLKAVKLEALDAGRRHKSAKALSDADATELTHITARLAEIDTELTDFKTAQIEASRLRLACSKTEIAEANAKHTLTRAIADVQKLRTALAGVAQQVGSPCTECGTPLTAAHMEHAKDAAQKRLDDATAAFATAKTAYETAQADSTAAQATLAALVMPDPSALNSERLGLTTSLNAIRQRERETAETLRVFQNVAERIKWIEDEGKENPHLAVVARLDTELSGFKDKIDKLDKRIEMLTDDQTIREAAVHVFGPAGVRAHILDDVTPFLNDRTAEYLGVMTDGRIAAVWTTLIKNAKGELREKFSIDVIHADGDRGFGLISGGEKRKVRLACAFALQDLVASRATKPFNLMVADEIDDALDPAGQERLMVVLQEKARERGSVVVISHNDLKSWIPQVWTVTKTADGSTVSASC